MTLQPPVNPVIGIVGSEGAYGRWLRRFFQDVMSLAVIGRDPAADDNPTERELIDHADVLVFAAPIRHTAQLVDDYVRIADGREAGKLWLDVTSIKQAPVDAMLRSRAEVVGLHPMTAPPKAPTLRGRVMIVCEARLAHWRGWLGRFIAASQAQRVDATPEHHDRVMALVQAMVHASHLAQGGVLAEQAGELGDLAALLPFRSPSFEMDSAIIARILASNPAIYEDIQFGNPYAPRVLRQLSAKLARLGALVDAGDEAARQAFRDEFLHGPSRTLGERAIRDGNYRFERLGYLLADLTETRSLSVHLPENQPGSLREMLRVFERHDINLASLHSSRTPSGQVHFRIGFDPDTDPERLADAAAELAATGIGLPLDTL